MPSVPRARKRILVLNQYYWPGVEATANLLTELCEDLGADYDVTVVTGRVRDQPELPSDEMLNGVRILRARSTAFDRAQLHLRAAELRHLSRRQHPAIAYARAP